MLKSNLELYEHNQETYENIKDIWKRSNKVAMLQATGTGKTYVIARVLEDCELLPHLASLKMGASLFCPACNSRIYQTVY